MKVYCDGRTAPCPRGDQFLKQFLAGYAFRLAVSSVSLPTAVSLAVRPQRNRRAREMQRAATAGRKKVSLGFLTWLRNGFNRNIHL